MAQYEYKVVKCRVVDQQYFTSWLAAYGWQVQNMQEFVDQVVNRSIGFSSNMGSGSMYGNAYFHPHTNNTAFSGYQTNHSWGSQMGTTVTNVKTKLSITFFRDISLPDHGELNAIESQWWKCSERYLNKVIDRGSADGGDKWPEFIELKRINQQAWDVRNRKKAAPQITAPVKTETIQKPVQQIENNPIQVPNIPATAAFMFMEVTHNVFQSGQAGIQIRLGFDIQHRKGLKCGIIAYFYDKNGNALVDLNQKFRTSNGKVSLGASFTPEFEDACFSDYIMFMPYAELDQPDGSHELSFSVQIYDDSGKTFIATSEKSRFVFSKTGSNMRGEPISSAGVEQTKPPAVKPAVGKKPAQAKPPKLVPAQTVLPLSKEERMKKFAEGAGWTEITEDRRLYIEGIFLSTEGKLATAKKNFNKALAMNPREDRYWSEASMCLASEGKMDESIALLEKGLRELPDSVNLKATMGYRYLGLKEYDKAESFAVELESSAQPYSAYNALMLNAALAEAKGNYKEAIKLFDQADAKAGKPNPMTGFGQQRCHELMKAKK